MLSRFRDHNLSAIEERYHAVSSSVVSLKRHPHVTAPAVELLQFIERALSVLQDRLSAVRKIATFDLMNDAEFDTALLLSRRLFDQLVVLLADVGRTVIFPAPPELRDSLAAVVSGLFGSDGQLLLFSDAGINYSILELRDRTSSIIEGLAPHGYVRPPAAGRMFLVGLPSAESDQALIHCIIAHEFGHYAWDWQVLGKFLELAPDVEPFSVLDTERQQMTAVAIAGEWATEIAADLFALYVFGPAYVCAAIHYAGAVTALDEASSTHPPTRLRLHALLQLMDELYTIDKDENGSRVFAYAPNMADLFGMWRPAVDARHLAVSGGPAERRLTSIALTGVSSRLERLRTLARRLALQYGPMYGVTDYTRDVTLVKCIASYVPPVQYIHEGLPQLTTTAAILNACWEYYLGGLEQFGRALPSDFASDRHRLNQVFNEFVLKTLELNALASRWWKARKEP